MKKLLILATLIGAIVFAVFIAHVFFGIIPRKEMGHSLAALGTYRSAIAIYHDDHGTYPTSLDLLIPKYIAGFPFAPNIAYPTGWFSYETHTMEAHFQYVSELRADDSGGWIYDNNPQSKDFGKIIINCTHMGYGEKIYSEM